MTETYDFQPDEVRRSDHSTLVHQHINWGMVRAHIVKRTGLARQETRIAPDQHSFLINLKGGARSGEDFVEGRSVGFTPRRPGSVVFVPAHREWSGWDEGDATGSYLFVSIDTTFIEEALGSKHLTGLKPAIGFRDNMIEDSLQRIAAELNNPDPISVTMAESQAVQLFVQLLRTQWRWSGAGQRWSLTAQSQAYKRHHREPTGEPAEPGGACSRNWRKSTALFSRVQAIYRQNASFIRCRTSVETRSRSPSYYRSFGDRHCTGMRICEFKSLHRCLQTSLRHRPVGVPPPVAQLMRMSRFFGTILKVRHKSESMTVGNCR